MNTDEKTSLHLGRQIRKIRFRITHGIHFFTTTPQRAVAGAIICLCIITTWNFRYAFYPDIYIHSPLGNRYRLTEMICDPILLLITVVVIFAIIVSISHPIYNLGLEREFSRVGLVNKADEPPFLKEIIESKKYPGAITFKFDSTGIPLKAWQDKQDEVEAAMNVNVIAVKRGRSMREIIVDAKFYGADTYDIHYWQDSYIPSRDFVIALGKGIAGVETADLNIVSHMLIAGSTGSGKTVMLKSILYQCLRKGADVRLVDFKGGANFSRIWKRNLDIVKDETGLSILLTEIIAEMERRKRLFDMKDCEDITQYNHRYGRLPRIIVAFDEVAQCFDKTGLSGVDKKTIQELEHKLSAIARLGRAFGIHLILGLQRPDANVITGQIKSNIDLRMCGRCDDTLSMIVLDNTDASREIGEEDQGKFMLSSGRLIQGFYFKDSDVKL